jgi:hypothetical protein
MMGRDLTNTTRKTRQREPAGAFRLSVICVGQTYELPGFKHPAREVPTPPSEYISLRTALSRRRSAYFFGGVGNLGMKGNSPTALRG